MKVNCSYSQGSDILWEFFFENIIFAIKHYGETGGSYTIFILKYFLKVTFVLSGTSYK